MNRSETLVVALLCVLTMALSSGFAPVRADTTSYVWTEGAGWLEIDFGDDDALLDLVISDVDKDGIQELIVVGYVTGVGTGRDVYVGIYHMAAGSLVLEAELAEDLSDGDDALTALRVVNCDQDDDQEIVVTGYGSNVVSGTSGRDIVVGIFRKSGSSIVPETEWYAKDFIGPEGQNNQGLGVAVGDVDADTVSELVVVSNDDFGAYVDTPMRIGVLSRSGDDITEETWYSENPTSKLDC